MLELPIGIIQDKGGWQREAVAYPSFQEAQVSRVQRGPNALSEVLILCPPGNNHNNLKILFGCIALEDRLIYVRFC